MIFCHSRPCISLLLLLLLLLLLYLFIYALLGSDVAIADEASGKRSWIYIERVKKTAHLCICKGTPMICKYLPSDDCAAITHAAFIWHAELYMRR